MLGAALRIVGWIFLRCSSPGKVPWLKLCVFAMSATEAQGKVAHAQVLGDFSIKSQDTAPKLDTSQWPLLLKNYDKLLIRSSHFTPIPSGCSPLKRDITNYIKCDTLLEILIYVSNLNSDLVS